tara:strand:+ start:1072 stop:2199 length:1128 start_codon:yes stop_codon:yes gene_type:complete
MKMTNNTAIQENDERQTVNHRGAGRLILGARKNPFLLRGEPGVGKTAIAKWLSEVTGMPLVMLDVPNLDIADVAMPIPNHETMTTAYYPNSIFRLEAGEPCIYCLDEYLKGSTAVQRMLHPMIEIGAPRVGSAPLPEGSIVYMTSNLADDGVGDNILAHTQMRLTEIELAKPRAYDDKKNPEWLGWAKANGVHNLILAWVHRNPDCLASYRESGQENNPYIFNPRIIGREGACVTPRTLELASNLIWARAEFTDDDLSAALSGTVGAAASASMMNYIRHFDTLPNWEDIVSDPMGTELPEKSGALAVLVYGALERYTTREEIGAFITYALRAEDDEFAFLYCSHLAREPKRQAELTTCREYTNWCTENADFIRNI